MRRYSRHHALKHYDIAHEQAVTLDPEGEAVDLIQRAVDSYWLLERRLSPAMERFQREIILREVTTSSPREGGE